MAFRDFSDREQGVKLLQRSLERGRVAHAYLFTGHQLDELEALARTLAKTLNCHDPVRRAGMGVPQPHGGGAHPDTAAIGHSGSGVRPSPGAAISGWPSALAGPGAQPFADISAPGDGRTPVAVHGHAHNAVAIGPAIDSCDACLSCRKVEHETHPDVHWVRPESKSRVILVDQMRDLMQAINLKPTEAEYKVAVIVAADRLRIEAANAFLKTLEEPPAKSILILLSTEPQRILETILSRCLRLNFAGDGARRVDAEQREWLARFSEVAASEQKSLLGRYRLMDVLLQKLGARRAQVEATLTARSPLQRYEDVEKDLREKWEDELAAAIEAEYRRQRADLLLALQWWLRDVWLHTLAAEPGLASFPGLAGTEQVARRLTPQRAMENLQVLEQTQRLLHTNVQEALALEVGLLKLQL